MKFEQLIRLIFKIQTHVTEFLYFFNCFFNLIKLKYFFKWKTASVADYYWFMYSNKNFTFFKKYL